MANPFLRVSSLQNFASGWQIIAAVSHVRDLCHADAKDYTSWKRFLLKSQFKQLLKLQDQATTVYN
jgi:hypothetical protein